VLAEYSTTSSSFDGSGNEDDNKEPKEPDYNDDEKSDKVTEYKQEQETGEITSTITTNQIF
jgi:hypothetical protein